MKLTASHKVSRKAGMTLLELTVVILVLLSLISILFIGARAWKKGSDRAASILQIRNVQQAVRSHANMSGLNPGDAMVKDDVIGPGKFIEIDPTLVPPAEGAKAHPAGSKYKFTIETPASVPQIGELYMKTTGTGSEPDTTADDFNPKEGTYEDW